jgi:hypothetical protein
MKYLGLLVFVIIGHSSLGQDLYLLQHRKHFDKELNQWTMTFHDFNLSAFKSEDTLHFDNDFQQDFRHRRIFLDTYKPILTYSPDSSEFIDIYSYQLNLEKKGNYYYANPEIDQAIFLCDPKRKYWDSIFFGTNSQWIDEVTWISNTKFILVGIIKSDDDKKMPLILLGDTGTQILIKYLNGNKNAFQNDKGYSSDKLKRMKIKGL